MNKVGEFSVKGQAYEDVMQILISNNYAVEVYAAPFQGTKNLSEREFRFKVYEDCEF